MEEFHRTRQKLLMSLTSEKYQTKKYGEKNTTNDGLTSDDMHSTLEMHRVHNVPSVISLADSNVT